MPQLFGHCWIKSTVNKVQSFGGKPLEKLLGFVSSFHYDLSFKRPISSSCKKEPSIHSLRRAHRKLADLFGETCGAKPQGRVIYSQTDARKSSRIIYQETIIVEEKNPSAGMKAWNDNIIERSMPFSLLLTVLSLSKEHASALQSSSEVFSQNIHYWSSLQKSETPW